MNGARAKPVAARRDARACRSPCCGRSHSPGAARRDRPAARRAPSWRGSTPPKSRRTSRSPRTIARDLAGKPRALVAVDQHLARRDREAFDRAAHRQQRRLQDVEGRRFRATSASATDQASARAADVDGQTLARGGGEKLGVPQSLRAAVARRGSRPPRRPGPASGPRPASSTPAISMRRRPRAFRRRRPPRRACRYRPSATRQSRRTTPPGGASSRCRRRD